MADGAAVAGAVGSIAAPIVQGAFTLGGLALQHKYNKELADVQNQYNLDMWNRQNEYNSPQAQMQRFQEAGLNPNLIYGQGTSGNASSPAVQVAPEPVRIDKGMQEIGKAFNLQQLMVGYANLRKALAEAKISEVNAAREYDHYEADKAFGATYYFDDHSGLFKPFPEYDENGNPVSYVVKYPAQRYYKLQHQADNFSRNSLLLNRWELINRQIRYLDPQIIMSNYDALNYKYGYWIGQGAKALNAVGSVIPKFKFSLGGSRHYTSPGGRQYYY